MEPNTSGKDHSGSNLDLYTWIQEPQYPFEGLGVFTAGMST